MEETSLESNSADVASREDLSLFDEEILWDGDPNSAYFRHFVGDQDNNVAVENEQEDASLQDYMETPMNMRKKTVPQPMPQPPPQRDVPAKVTPKATRSPILSVPIPVNNENDIEEAEAERKKQERAARIADVPPVVFVGNPNQHMTIRAKRSYIIPDWASLSAQTDLSFISRNRRAFMLVLLVFIIAVIGLSVALVLNFQNSGRGESDEASNVASAGDAQDGDVIPSLAPSVTPTPLPTQQVIETTLAPEWTNASNESPTVLISETPTLAPVLLETPTTTTTTSPTEASQTTTDPVSTASPTVSPTFLPTTTSPTRVPTMSPTTRAPTMSPTTRAPTLSPTKLPTRSPTNEPTSKPPTISISAELEELIAFLSSESPGGGAALSNQGSPQFLAAKWLSEESLFPSYPDWKKLQRFAIATIYFSMGGDGWTNADGWLSDQDECEWYETRDEDDVCNSDGRFQMLYNEGNNLKGQLPPEIALLSDTLVRLDVSENNLSGTIPTEFGLLASLTKLSLKRNANIGGTLPTELGNMSSMTFFGVGRINLIGTLPTEIGMLSALETVGFERNKLTGTIPSEFGRLSLLTQAAFDFNQFSGTVPTQLLELPLLEKVALEYNDFTGVIEFEVGCPIDVLKADCDEVVCACCNQCS